MIHLAGETSNQKLKRALEELEIYEQEGIDGAIIEDYHGDIIDVENVLRASQNKTNNLILGVNVLRNPYLAFELANDYGAKFVQFDSVQAPNININIYNQLREKFPNIAVLGGIGFKYIPPTGNSLEVDLEEGKSRCDAIVTTGTGTGIETPLNKLKEYKNILKDFPLIVGARVNGNNAYFQLRIADGAIIGSYFKKNNNTNLPIDKSKVQQIIGMRKYALKMSH